jgi:flagellar motility protein MotE (MotC chaperone)
MMALRQAKSRVRGLVAAGVAGLLLAVSGAAGCLVPPAAAQGWTPTVATAPGGTLTVPMPQGSMNRVPAYVDPRYFPSPHSTALSSRPAAPQGAWSPIVTGALPQSGAQAPATTQGVPPAAQGAAPRGVSEIGRDSLSPVRPLAPQAVAAAGGTSAVETGASSLPGDGAEGLFQKPGPLDALPSNASAAQQYCFNTADSAADARFAWQAKKIADMEAELDKKARQLEIRTEEYKRWLERRDDFSRKAHEKLVGLYTRMRADAAAVQLATLDEEMAAAVVMKLETKVASQIMSEMDSERAAKIASIISGAGRVSSGRQSAVRQASPGSPPEGGPQDAGGPAEVPR